MSNTRLAQLESPGWSLYLISNLAASPPQRANLDIFFPADMSIIGANVIVREAPTRGVVF
jgi:hypothetical protein